MGAGFLLEIGTEEIPDWMIRPALAELRQLFTALLAEERLGGEVTAVEATPRRLVLRAEELLRRQPDTEETLTGPPVKAGERAAAGFARKLGIPPGELARVETPKGEYFSFRRRVPGRESRELLAERLGPLILKIHWPKTMYWTGKDGVRFIRPIRWLVALLGGEVIPFELAGVRAGPTSCGHRRLGAATVPVTVDDYEEALAKNFVLVPAARRRRRIEEGIAALLEGTGLRLQADDALLDTLTYMTEYPTPILGSFEESFLALPQEVLTTVMRHHQRYFSVLRADGTLAPHFLAVMNIEADAKGLVRRGNERVLRARFNDARFFWDVDQKKPLADRVKDLAAVTFQKDLGSYLEKAHRMVALVRDLGGSESAQRAALLAKCDLTTEMVGEFPELQGLIGGLYARAQGEPEPVAQAVYEHYKPGSMEEEIPSTTGGLLVALADKLDTLRECFRIGLIPSGSKDPLALRRAAQGVVRILVEGGLTHRVSLLTAGDEKLAEFLLERARYYFREVRGFAYDEVNAVLAAGAEDLVDTRERLEAVRAVRPTENFEPIAASFKRIKNILRQAGFTGGGAIDPELLEAEEEKQLYREFQRLRREVESYRQAREYGPALEAIASLRPQVDRFFDHVLVNAPEPRLRRNRLELLARLLTEFSSIADFSEIVTAGT